MAASFNATGEVKESCEEQSCPLMDRAIATWIISRGKPLRHFLCGGCVSSYLVLVFSLQYVYISQFIFAAAKKLFIRSLLEDFFELYHRPSEIRSVAD